MVNIPGVLLATIIFISLFLGLGSAWCILRFMLNSSDVDETPERASLIIGGIMLIIGVVFLLSTAATIDYLMRN